MVLADDHAVVRTGLRLVLERAGGFEVVSEAEERRLQRDLPLNLAARCEGAAATHGCAVGIGLTQVTFGVSMQRKLRAARTPAIRVTGTFGAERMHCVGAPCMVAAAKAGQTTVRPRPRGHGHGRIRAAVDIHPR